ncbi:MAG TPA: hypothetical protein VFZ08_07010 [Terriglobia bacterium]|nr:hypothetical protein [Terriglobia bacterium]
MRDKLMTLLVCMALCLLGVAITAPADAQSSGPLTGSWQCESHGGQQGDLAFTLDLQQNGNSITGSISTDQGVADVSSATFKDGILKFIVTTSSNEYHVTGKYEGGKLAGTWTAGGGQDKGTWAGTKANKSSQ